MSIALEFATSVTKPVISWVLGNRPFVGWVHDLMAFWAGGNLIFEGGVLFVSATGWTAPILAGMRDSCCGGLSLADDAFAENGTHTYLLFVPFP